MFQNAFLIGGRIGRTEYGISLIIYVLITLVIRNIAEESTNSKYIFIFYLPTLWFVFYCTKECLGQSRSKIPVNDQVQCQVHNGSEA